MIENIEGFPDNVVGLRAKGQVTKEDYERVLVPKVEAAFSRHSRIRLYYELGPEFSQIDPARRGRISKLESSTSPAGSAPQS